MSSRQIEFQSGDWNWAVPVWYTCGHFGLIERSSLFVANYVAEYAETVLCWRCWLAKHNPEFLKEMDAKALRKVR